ncbi:MAG: release factor glutamine methyltransferase [Nocardioidaceae bacterium]|nr:release factor glutamine methyltransferase [Nocardioidaceae bacterium]
MSSNGVSLSTEVTLVEQLRAAGCVFADDEAKLLIEAASGSQLEALVARRVGGEPLEYVLGWAEFCGLRVTVERGVFVPRRRTEFLVERALELAAPGGIVVELCCGTAAVGVALLAALPGIELHVADIDPVAVSCARRNVEAAGGHVHEGDLYAPLPAALRGRVDLLAVNAPYVPTEAIALMPPEARLHEARTALDGGPDGVDVQRRVVAEALDWLAPGGHLLIETSLRQAPLTVKAFENAGLIARTEHSDEADGTVVVGTRTRP